MSLFVLIIAAGLWETAGWIVFTAVVSTVVGVIATRRIESRTEKRVAAQKRITDVAERERERLADEAKELLARIKSLEEFQREFGKQLALMGQTVLPLYEVTKRALIKILTHPSAEFKEGDDLLARVGDPDVIPSREENDRLKVILKKRETDPNPEISDLERLAAKILPTIIEMVVVEKETVDAVVTSIQPVALSEPPKKDKESVDG